MSNNCAVHQEVTKIPDMDGTGPRWLGERKFSRRGRWNFENSVSNLPDSSGPATQQDAPLGEPVYGIGRGGLPRGGSRRMGRRWDNSFRS